MSRAACSIGNWMAEYLTRLLILRQTNSEETAEDSYTVVCLSMIQQLVTYRCN